MSTPPSFLRRVKSAAWNFQARVRFARGIPAPLPTEPRGVLERIVLPWFANEADFRKILFVGADIYTCHYERSFKGKESWARDNTSSDRSRLSTSLSRRTNSTPSSATASLVVDSTRQRRWRIHSANAIAACAASVPSNFHRSRPTAAVSTRRAATPSVSTSNHEPEPNQNVPTIFSDMNASSLSTATLSVSRRSKP